MLRAAVRTQAVVPTDAAASFADGCDVAMGEVPRDLGRGGHSG
jgi:hypothetical protein